MVYSNRNAVRHAAAFRKIDACVKISVQGIATMNARKEITCTGTDRMALGADLACVVGAHVHDMNSFDRGFVRYKLPQLIKAPSMQPEIHPFSQTLLPDAFDVFQNKSVSWFPRVDDLFADVVVHPSHETLLSASYLFQKLLGGFCAFGLKFRPQTLESYSSLFHKARMKESFLRSNSKMPDAQINAHSFSIASNRRMLPGKGNVQEQPAFFHHDLRSLI